MQNTHQTAQTTHQRDWRFTFERVLLFIIKSGLYITPFIPLVVTPFLIFPATTGKFFVFRAIVEIIVGAFVLLAILNKKYRPSLKNPLVITIVIFLVIMSFAAIGGVHPLRSFWSTYQRGEGVLLYLHLAGYFMVLSSVFRAKQEWLRLFKISVWVSLAVVVFALVSPGPGLGTIIGGSTLGNPTFLAIYSLMNVYLALLIFDYRSKNSTKTAWMYPLVALFFIGTMIFTCNRSALIGLVIGSSAYIAVLLLAQFRIGKLPSVFDKKWVVHIIVAAGMLLFSALLLLGAFGHYAPCSGEYSVAAFTKPIIRSGNARLFLWNIGYHAFLERPILGWGPDNFITAYFKHSDPRLYGFDPINDRAHNSVIDFLVSSGLLGLIAYLALYLAGVWLLAGHYFKKRISLYTAALVISLFAAHFAHTLFTFDTITSFLLFFMLLGFISAQGEHKEHLEDRCDHMSNGKIAIVTALFAIVFILSIYYFVIIPAKGAWALEQLSTGVFFAKETSLVERKLKEALRYNTSYNPFVALHYGFLIREDAALWKYTTSEFRYLSSLAYDALQESLSHTNNSQDVRLYRRLGSVLFDLEEYDESLRYYTRGYDISPYYINNAIELAKTHVQLGQKEHAISILKKAHASIEDYPQSDFLKHLILFLATDFDDEVFTPFVADIKQFALWRLSDYNFVLAAEFATSAGELEKAVQLYEHLIALNEPHPPLFLQIRLANVYKMEGDYAKAKEIAKRVMQQDPRFIKGGMEFIQNLEK